MALWGKERQRRRFDLALTEWGAGALPVAGLALRGQRHFRTFVWQEDRKFILVNKVFFSLNIPNSH